MRKKVIGNQSLSQEIVARNKKALAMEPIVNLSAYRNVAKEAFSKTILVVDDDPMMLSAVKKIFERDHHHVVVAEDALGLSRTIEHTTVDLILLDIKLPWVDGYELCGLLKTNPFLKGIPIVFLSGNSSEEDIKMGYEAGCDAYIVKPFDVAELQRVINGLLLKSAVG